MPNRLADELSPYLLQHAGNPVEWQAWGPEAIELARRQDRPIFLSIGYSSCHWCHVMAHDSFEDPQIARLLNDNFVCIKVDREERPDLDQIYMEAVQALTGQGGWPLSAFLTPSLEPFFGGTFWPARARGGMLGFDQILLAVAKTWKDRRGQVHEQANRLTRFLRENQQAGRTGTGSEPAEVDAVENGCREVPVPVFPGGEQLDDEPLDEAEATAVKVFDRQFGGFGAAPKFPQPMLLQLLLRRWKRLGGDDLLQIVTTTLDRMAAGGIYDHLGGGFHRYSVDARWLVPHFEKMLYDNALLAGCYVEAWQATGNAAYAQTARETFDYVLRDMTDPRGGFYSSEDADSEGREGKFYVWTPAEIAAVLGPEAAEAFCREYDVTDAGNFERANILNRAGKRGTVPICRNGPEGASHKWGLSPFFPELADARTKLLAARSTRVRPGRDDKVLTSWNGLMIEALARGGAALDEPRYIVAAATAAAFLLDELRDKKGRLLHCWRQGRAKGNAFLDDHASLGNALVTLYESFPSRNWLDTATALTDEILARFADDGQGGFFYTAADHEPLIVRRKDFIDSAVPSGNGLAAMLLLRLGRLLHRRDYLTAAESTLCTYLDPMQQMPFATAQLLLALEAYRT
jgi:uncharacterized protein YyaL (SSP411 family)